MMMILVLFTKECLASSDDGCDLNCVVSTGEDNQSGNTDNDMDSHDTGIIVGVESKTMDLDISNKR